MADIKENLQQLITENADKELIEKVAVISNQIDELIAESEKQKSDYKELLSDYAKIVRHSVYGVDNRADIDNGTKAEFSFESFVDEWQKSKK